MLAHVVEQQALTEEDVAELRAEVAVGFAEADSGEFIEFTAEDVIRRGRDALRQDGATAEGELGSKRND